MTTKVGKAITALDGTDLTIIATGSLVALSISAANGLAKEGISVRVIDMHTIKPLDKDAIVKAAKKPATSSRRRITSSPVVSAAPLQRRWPMPASASPFRRLGIPGEDFPPLGDCYELYAHFGYDPEGIKRAARAARQIIDGKDAQRYESNYID